MEITARLTGNAKVSILRDDQVVNFSVAINDSYKPKGSREVKKLTTFIQCVYWINSGIVKHLTKGASASELTEPHRRPAILSKQILVLDKLHHDYGYWYKNNGFLFPEMLSVLTAITAATKENGCLQMIRAFHKMGRVELGFA